LKGRKKPCRFRHPKLGGGKKKGGGGGDRVSGFRGVFHHPAGDQKKFEGKVGEKNPKKGPKYFTAPRGGGGDPTGGETGGKRAGEGKKFLAFTKSSSKVENIKKAGFGGAGLGPKTWGPRGGGKPNGAGKGVGSGKAGGRKKKNNRGEHGRNFFRFRFENFSKFLF